SQRSAVPSELGQLRCFSLRVRGPGSLKIGLGTCGGWGGGPAPVRGGPAKEPPITGQAAIGTHLDQPEYQGFKKPSALRLTDVLALALRATGRHSRTPWSNCKNEPSSSYAGPGIVCPILHPHFWVCILPSAATTASPQPSCNLAIIASTGIHGNERVKSPANN